MKDYNWPWTNCKGKLKHWGAKIVLHPGAKTELNFVTQQSKNLNDEQGKIISRDIITGLFELVETDKDSSGLRPQAPKKQKLQKEVVFGEEEDVEDEEADEEDEDAEAQGAELENFVNFSS
ncbi:hypothetical protein CROQUDRAFT_90721 [Cronartium quercuum f. sp. fusiforme G11]|uniref:Uncharacterized protein n=1 Tax=Cronartium quercuum f. sp. fusiforme G11 TaxID=708437 RepID=A0A9P6NQ25_9BASI|nr:hypothetical protein CROQUDRAFT_90721 [Cronartium quercuum f. sp. fusiforme G11]